MGYIAAWNLLKRGSWMVLTVFSAVAAAALGDDWPQWRGPDRDGVWKETGLIEKFPPTRSRSGGMPRSGAATLARPWPAAART